MIFNYKNFHFSEVPKIIVKPPGPKARKILEELTKFDPPFPPKPETPMPPLTNVFEEAKGATIRDVDGNIFIDLGAGISVANVGHCNPVIVKALKVQAEKLWHLRPWNSSVRLNFLQKIEEIMPGEMKNNIRLGFATGGSDAVEGALKIVKLLKDKGGIIAFDGAFHGSTHGAIALSANVQMRKGLRNIMPGAYHVPYPYCYRCPFNDEYPECDMMCIRFIENQLQDPYAGMWEPAAMFIEPIQGEGGYIIPPDEFMPEIRRITQDNDILLVADEIQTGFCRSGKTFAVEHWDVTPDIMLLSKAMAAGLPGFAAIIMKRELLDVEGARIPHGGTFRSNHLAMSVALANIEFMVKNDIAKRSKDLGIYTMKALRDTLEDTKFVGDIRGKGLMIGIEFVKDKETKEPFAKFVNKVTDKMLEKGYIILKCGHYKNVIRLMPPIIITKDMLDVGVAALGDSVSEVEKSY